MSTGNDNGENGNGIDRIRADRQRLGELYHLHHTVIPDKRSDCWKRLTIIDKEIVKKDPELLSQIQHREKRIGFIKTELRYGAFDTDDKTRTWAEKAVKMHMRYRDELLQFAHDYKGDIWIARSEIWDEINELNAKDEDVRDQISAIEARLPKATTDKVVDDVVDPPFWSDPEITPEQQAAEEEWHNEWVDELGDVTAEVFQEELRQTEEMRIRLSQHRADRDKRVADELSEDVIIQDAKDNLARATEEYKRHSEALFLLEDQYKERESKLSDRLDECNAEYDKAFSELVKLFDMPNMPQYPDFYPNFVQIPWEDLDDPDERRTALLFENEMTERPPIVQVTHNQIQDFLRSASNDKLRVLEDISQFAGQRNETLATLQRTANSARETMEEADRHLSSVYEARQAEAERDAPPVDHQSEIDAFAYKEAQEKFPRITKKDGKDVNVKVKGASAKLETGFVATATATVVTPQDQIKELREEVAELKAEKAKREEEEAERSDDIQYRIEYGRDQFAVDYATAHSVFRNISAEELQVRGVPPRKRAVMKLNELHEAGKLEEQPIALKLPPQHLKDNRRKAECMIALRMGVEVTENPVRAVVLHRMDNTGNQIGVKLSNYDDVVGVAMVTIHKIGEWSFTTAGSVYGEMWRECESNTEGVDDNIKDQYNDPSKDLDYFIEAHKKILANVKKKMANAKKH